MLQKYGIPTVTKYILSFIAISFIIFYRLTNPSKPTPGALFYPVLIVFIGWSIVLLFLVSLNPHSELWPGLSFPQRILGQQFFFLPYVLPLILLYAKFDLNFFSHLFHIALILIIPAILIQLSIILFGIAVGDWEQQRRAFIFDIGSSFLLLIAHYSKKKYIFNIVLLYTLLMIFLFVQWGRRAMLIDSILVMFAMIILRLKTYFLTFNDRIKIYFAGFLLIIVILSFGNIAESTYVFQRGFNKEAIDQSRGSVYEAFFLDFHTTSDWIFGRGLGAAISREAYSDRLADFVESGFLVLLYKGGLLYLIPFLILLLRASYLGFYKSNNDLVKALALLLLIYVISMYAWNWPEFSTKYVFMWISISVCYTQELRNASNEEIYRKINFRGGSF
ncbi:MAG: hypothetical protein MUO72_10090 [Bacteroidales bacterium]|nr:hypothetical protein [Bacteroidales bacterium]